MRLLHIYSGNLYGASRRCCDHGPHSGTLPGDRAGNGVVLRASSWRAGGDRRCRTSPSRSPREPPADDPPRPAGACRDRRSRAIRSCRLPRGLVTGVLRRRGQARESAARFLGARRRDRHALDRADRAARPSRSGRLQQPLYRRFADTAVRRCPGDRADVPNRHEAGCPHRRGACGAAAGARHAGRCDGPHSGQPHGGVERPRSRGRRARAVAWAPRMGLVGRRRCATTARGGVRQRARQRCPPSRHRRPREMARRTSGCPGDCLQPPTCTVRPMPRRSLSASPTWKRSLPACRLSLPVRAARSKSWTNRAVSSFRQEMSTRSQLRSSA